VRAEEYFSCHDNRLARHHCDMKDKRGSKRCEVDSLVYWREGQDRVANRGMSKWLARLELYRQATRQHSEPDETVSITKRESGSRRPSSEKGAAFTRIISGAILQY